MLQSAKERQHKKFEKLYEGKQDKAASANDKKYGNITKRWVVNLADIRLEPESESWLKIGLNFAVTRKKIPVDDIITATEGKPHTSSKM